MNLPRIHLIELEDLPGFPAQVRDGMMDCLRFFFTLTNVYDNTAPAVGGLLKKAGTTEVLDLCSGGGGAAELISKLLRKNIHPEASIILSDIFPNHRVFEYLQERNNGALKYINEPVDALRVPIGLPKVRTLYTAFHHFQPDQAQQLLLKAAAEGIYLGIFEGTSRRWLNFLLVIPLPLLVLLATPFIRPFRWSRLFFTYLLPLIPAGVFWDGLASMLRLYSVKELKRMTMAASTPTYHWEVRQVRHWLGVKSVHVLGWPI